MYMFQRTLQFNEQAIYRHSLDISRLNCATSNMILQKCTCGTFFFFHGTGLFN